MKRYAFFAVPALIILSGLLVWSLQMTNAPPEVEELPLADVTPASPPETPAPVAQAEVDTIEEEKIADSDELTTTVLENTQEEEPPNEQTNGYDISTDESVKNYVRNNLNPQLNSWLAEQHLLSKVVRAVNAMDRGNLVSKHRPVKTPALGFKAEKRGDAFTISLGNYQRYTPYVSMLETLGPDKLVAAYNFHYPALAEAFSQLGVKDRDFRTVTKRVLQSFIQTPELDQAPLLNQKSVMFKFADPALEALPAPQKLLLRMGPENRAKVKSLAQELLSKL